VRHRTPSRGVAALLSCALVLGLGTVATVASQVVTATPAQAAAGSLSLDHDATAATVLAGEDARITLGANLTGDPGDVAYNVGFVATLPPGATYVPGSATPASGPGAPGEPVATQVKPSASESTWYWVLVWTNVTDLPAGGAASIGFAVDLDEARFPVGSELVVPAQVLGSDDERMVPKATVTDAGTTVQADVSASDTARVDVSALEITKAHLSPEDEFLRGMPNTYTLTVRAAPGGAVTGAQVRDLMPAELKFESCVSVDPGGCGTLAGAAFTTDADGAHTQVMWDLGTLAAGSTTVITYTASAGYRALDDAATGFTGPSLRQDPTGTEATNTATATGTYQGAVRTAADRAVTSSDEHTVNVLDVSLVKTGASQEFRAGEEASFALDVRGGALTSATDVVVTDTLPDGLCVFLPSGFATPAGWPAECQSLPRRPIDGATLTSAVVNADGTTTLLLAVADLAPGQTRHVTYSAYMRAAHADGSPTATGETFTNAASVAATTHPVAGSPETGPVAVTNGSAAAVAPQGPSLVKEVWPNTDRTPITGAASCPAVSSPQWTSDGQPLVRLGDLLCFQITLQASSGAALRDVVVRDFVPVGTELMDVRVAGNPAGVTVDRIGSEAAWQVGTVSGAHRYVPAGATVTFQVVARVTDTQPTGKDILGNLAKMRWLDADNRVAAQRTQVDFAVAPAAPLTLTKTVLAASGTGTNQQVTEGEVVTYRLAVRHAGTAADGSDHPVTEVEVWDALPAGFTCADLVSSVTCGAGPTSSTAGRSYVRTVLSGTLLGPDGVLTPGETATFDVQLRIPSPLSIASAHRNDASIVSYEIPTTDGRPGGTSATYYPAGSLADPAEPNAPAANASATVRLPDATVAKAITTTSVEETGNNRASQATIGETVDYTYSVTLPAHTSMFRGVLRDTLPTGGRLVGLTVTGSSTPGLTVTSYTSGTGATCSPTATNACLDTTTGALHLPPVLTNSGSTPVTYSVSVRARVANVTANSHNATLTNTATLTSRDTATSTTDVTRASQTATATVVVPDVSVTKTPLNVSGSPVDPLPVGTSQVVTYRLTATNTTGRPAAHDAVVVDCLPPGMTLVTPLDPGLTAQPGTGSPCAASRTQITWTVGDIAGGASPSATYQATVPADAAGAASLVNTATLLASTIDDGQNGTSTERTLTATESGTVTLASPTGSKTADVTWAVPGQTVTFTLVTRLPANANFYDAAVIDVLPSGLKPDLAAVTVECTGGDAAWQTSCADAPVATTYTGTTTTRVVWPLGDLAPSSTERVVTITLPVTVDPAGSATAGATLTNAMGLGWFQSDANRTVTPTTTFNNAPTLGTVAVTVREPAVSVTKSVDDATVEPGQVFTYSVSVAGSTVARNAATAYDVAVVDTLPVGVVPVDLTGAPLPDGPYDFFTWDSSTRQLSWTEDEVASGDVATRSFRVKLDDADTLTGAALRNTVRATSWESQPTDGRSYGPSNPATVDVRPQLPLVNATKTQYTANPVVVGQEVAYGVTLTNAGGGTAVALDVTDTLPTGWEYVAGSASIQVDDVRHTLDDPTGTGTLVWTDVLPAGATLAPGASVTLVYSASPTEDAASADGSAVAHTNTAAVTRVTDAAGGDSYDGGDGSYTGTDGTATARIHAADLVVTKTAATWVAGTSTNTWTVRVRNDGPDPAVGVVVHDVIGTLPDGVSLVSVAGSDFTCAAGTGSTAAAPVTDCTLSTALAPGATATLTVTVDVADDVAAGTTATNTATVSATTFDPDDTNDSATSTATVTTAADLELVKTGPASVDAGASATWTVTVTNHGPSVSRASAADPVVVTDTLPAGVEVDDADVTATGATCELDGRTLTCERTTDLAVGASFSVQVTGLVDAALRPADGPLVNTAAVTPVTDQGADDHDDEDSTSTTVTHAESLTVTKTIDGTLVAGETGTYAITVRNDGPSAARGVVVTDDLPTGLTFAGGVDSDDDWTCSGTTSVVCELDGVLGVGAGAASSFTFDVDVASGRTGDILNTAVVGSDWADDQDSDDVTTGATVHADLGITKSHTGATVTAGTGTTFTLTVTNHGPSDAPGPITVSDTVPAGLPLDGAPAPDGGTCTVGATTPGGGQPVTCTLTGGLVAGGTWEIEIPVTVPADAAPATIRNTATVSGPPTLDEGADTHDNSASDDVIVVREADLSITKSASAATVTAGTDVTYTLAVENAGPSVAAATVVTDSLDARLAPVSATWAGHPGACTISGQDVTCEIGELLPSDGTVTITVVARVRSSVADGASITNTAEVVSTTPDVDGEGPSSDEDDATITVDTDAELSLVKTTETTSVHAGEAARFSIVVTNDGPSDVPAPVTVVDTLPEGLSFVSAATTGTPAWDCSASGQDVTCELAAAVVAGADAPTLRITALVSPSADPGTLTNEAYATSDLTGDSDPDTSTLTVTTSADLGITKSHTGTAVAGEPFAWTLTVTNAGPSDSRADAGHPVVVTDVLPEGVTFDGSAPVTGGGFTCVAGAPVTVGGATRDTVECERPTTLAAGDTVSVTVPVLLDADLQGDVTNTATVTPGRTPQPSGTTLPDTDTDDVTVTGIADLSVAKDLLTPAADVVAGREIRWNLDVTNHGPSTARADASTPLVVVDDLPAEVQDATASGTGWDCTTSGTTIRCERDTDLAVGAAPSIEVVATVRPSTTTAVVNAVTVTPGSTPQAAPGGPATGTEPDTDDVSVVPGTEADLALTKAVVTAPVAGGTGVYRLQVLNLGPSDARDVVVVDHLPAGLTSRGVVGASAGAVWDCTGTDDVTCELGAPLPAGEVAWLDLEVAAASSLTADVVNTATVSSSTTDPDPANNTATATATPGRSAALSVTKTHRGEGRVGADVTYDLVVRNAGPSDATDVVARDLVPAALQVTGVRAGDTWECVVGEHGTDGTPVLCTRDVLPARATAPAIHVDVVVGAAAYPGVTNVVEVSSSTPGPDGTVVTAADSDELVVDPLVDLAVTKTLDGDAVQVGSAATYVLTVTNHGPTADPGPVTLTDELPAGLTFDTARGADCAAEGRTVTCTVDGLGVGESVEVRLTVLVGDGVGDTVTNTATVTSDATDTDPTNDTASVTVDVERRPLAVTGVEAAMLALLAAFLLVGGVGAVVVARRRDS